MFPGKVAYSIDRWQGEPSGADDIRTDRELFDKSLSKLRVTAEEAMRGLGGGNFGG